MSEEIRLGQADTMTTSVRSGRAIELVCDCGRAHRIAFSMPQPGTDVIGLRIERVTEAERAGRVDFGASS